DAVRELARRVVVATGIDLVALAERRRRSTERVEEELIPAALQRELAGYQSLAAVVEVVANAQDLVVEELGDARAARLGRLTHVAVLARLPDHGLVVRQHAESGGRGAAVGVHVVDVVGDARGVE